MPGPEGLDPVAAEREAAKLEEARQAVSSYLDEGLRDDETVKLAYGKLQEFLDENLDDEQIEARMEEFVNARREALESI